MTDFNILIREENIKKKVTELAEQISKDHNNHVFALCVLNSACVFACDLVRELSRHGTEVMFDFVKTKSYDGKESTGKVKVWLWSDIKDKDVLIIEDIVDTGLTAKQVTSYLLKQGAKSVKLCSLLDKPERRKVRIKIDYLGFTIPDRFVVGYGMDHETQHRELPYIAAID